MAWLVPPKLPFMCVVGDSGRRMNSSLTARIASLLYCQYSATELLMGLQTSKTQRPQPIVFDLGYLR